jgi:hypothetical protein
LLCSCILFVKILTCITAMFVLYIGNVNTYNIFRFRFCNC